jgi:DNA-binding CsgD family transcriptional regulator
VIEACYRTPAEDVAWADGVLDALGGVRAPGTGIYVFEHSSDCASGHARVITGGKEVEVVQSAGFSALLARFGAKALRGLYYPRRPVATQLEIAGDLPPDTLQWLAQYRSDHGAADAAGVFFHPAPGIAGVLYQGAREPIRLSRHQRSTLTRVALHLEVGYRLRLRTPVVLAVIAPDGRILHREEAAADDASRFAAHVQRVELARSRAHRREPTALETWTAMLAGSVSLVERREGTKRSYLVVENPRKTQPLRALTSSEIAVVSDAARGVSAKLIAYGLGLSAARVSALLASAASKVGLATRTELVRIAAILTRDPRASFDAASLTAAERDVLELVVQGLSNDEIARMRSRSVRTIANQVAAILRKTGSATRRALVTRSSDR